MAPLGAAQGIARPSWNFWPNGDRVLNCCLLQAKLRGNLGAVTSRLKPGNAVDKGLELLSILLKDLAWIVNGDDVLMVEVKKILARDVQLYKRFRRIIKKTGRAKKKKTQKTGLPSLPDDAEILKTLKAAIMSLDWRVEQEQIKEYEQAIALLRQRYGTSRRTKGLMQPWQA